MKTGWGLLAFAIIFALYLLPAPDVQSQGLSFTRAQPCADPNVRNDVRPNPDGPPTEVKFGLRMIDLTDINDVNQSMTVDYGIQMTWTDPRLVHLAGCEVPIAEVWDPNVTIMNSGRLFRSEPEVVRIEKGGKATYIQRFFGTIATYHNLQKFPFDRQILRIIYHPLLESENEVFFVKDDQITGRRNLLNISSWTVNKVDGAVRPYLSNAMGRKHTSYVFSIYATRITAYYIWKVILPLCLIVSMSWAVFWINPGQFGPQIGLSATSMLTLIAFIFATTNMVPALGYFTILDHFIIGSTVLVFLAFVESLLASYLVSRDKVVIAERMDTVSRILFPTVFVIFAGTVLLI
ncbi:MAG: hypothetical protein ACR2OR_12690 [Hyphomicrobiales bacterium]